MLGELRETVVVAGIAIVWCLIVVIVVTVRRDMAVLV